MRHELKQFNAIDKLSAVLVDGCDPFPQIIEIHPTDICNHTCNFCFHKGKGYDQKRSKDLLGLKHYESLFHEMSELRIVCLSISGGGEPTIDNRLPNLITSANQNSLEVRLVSNGNFIDNELLGLLCKISEIRFSIDAISDSTYSRMRNIPEGLFYKTIENLQRVIEIKKSESLELQIGATFLIGRLNYFELVAFCESMVKIGVDEIIVKHNIFNEREINPETMDKILDELEIIRSNIVVRRPIQIVLNNIKCYTPYFKIALNPYGDVYSCCLASQPGELNGYKLGNIKDNNLADIWRLSKDLRHSLIEKGVHCNNCNYTDFLLNKSMLKKQ